MASVISRTIGVGGKFLGNAGAILTRVSGAVSRASKLADILRDLHANDVEIRTVLNKVRTDLADHRTAIVALRTLANELKADHNALDAVAGAGANQTAAADVAALTAATATANAAALNTSVEDA
jgi:peptidoglycan hydrolase CwlO-like protein